MIRHNFSEDDIEKAERMLSESRREVLMILIPFLALLALGMIVLSATQGG